MASKRTLITLSAAEIFVHMFLVIFSIILISTKGNNYIVKNKNNYFEYQENFKCAGYSSAYVLRNLGISAKGIDIYNEIENKETDGKVNPTEIPHIFESRGLKCSINYNKSLDDLKKDLNDGVPIIVFVKLNTTSNYNHYLTLVGYNKNKLFFAESMKSEVNMLSDKTYNRSITNIDFLEMWKVDNDYQNIYFKVEKN